MSRSSSLLLLLLLAFVFVAEMIAADTAAVYQPVSSFGVSSSSLESRASAVSLRALRSASSRFRAAFRPAGTKAESVTGPVELGPGLPQRSLTEGILKVVLL
ncbi:hypothetical protein OPV22_000577 [Ensete ventricosum]|uniref:Uncharacterized protein n=1 Tax=Ensete ventricosum TaxID=4639 RepID=A0AAV8RTE9_ENSVE|nr:hypothetical protein OPV22_000577 [Ensete ventricosum]